MKYFILILNLFLCLNHYCFAGTVEWNGIQITYDDAVSLKDFTVKTVPALTPGTTVYGSCFSKEVPETVIFRAATNRVTFIECNLDNVFVPANANIVKTVYRTPPRKFKVQNDLEDWILNDDLTPKEPMRKEEYLRLGISIDPRDLPLIPLSESLIQRRERELNEARNP